MTTIYVVGMAKANKPKTVAKTVLVQVRVSPAEKAEWQGAANAAQRKLSDWLRLAGAAAVAAQKGK
jgi:hypothetical protein